MIESDAYLAWLETECGYQFVRMLPTGRWAAVTRMMFTAAVIVGKVGDTFSFEDRWCYHGMETARAALNRWDGTGEPTGWHRHPATGRRVSEDGSLEIFL